MLAIFLCSLQVTNFVLPLALEHAAREQATKAIARKDFSMAQAISGCKRNPGTYVQGGARRLFFRRPKGIASYCPFGCRPAPPSLLPPFSDWNCIAVWTGRKREGGYLARRRRRRRRRRGKEATTCQSLAVRNPIPPLDPPLFLYLETFPPFRNRPKPLPVSNSSRPPPPPPPFPPFPFALQPAPPSNLYFSLGGRTAFENGRNSPISWTLVHHICASKEQLAIKERGNKMQ